MTKARCRLVDTSVSRWYHCISRCCRKAHLLSGENGFQRKDWIDQRLKELNEIFAISVGGFSTMDSHLHLLLRIDCEEAESWSDQGGTNKGQAFFVDQRLFWGMIRRGGTTYASAVREMNL